MLNYNTSIKEDKNINVTIVDPVFFDKENVRLNA